MSALSARAAYKKQTGTLALTSSQLIWTQDGQPKPSVRVAHKDVNNLFTSKEGVAQAKIKVTATGHDDAGYNFTFASAQAQAAADRNAFKEALTTILGRNRAGAGAVSATPSASVSASPTKPSTPSGATSNNARAPLQHPAGVTGLTRPGMTPRATSVASDGRSGISSAPGAGLTSDDIRLRKKVLAANPELAVLHRDLVMTGQITEPEFWEGRQYLLDAQAASDAQKKGRPGQLVDPRPETVDGEVKIVITPQLVHDLFEEYPVVATAYAENVPDALSEAEFWSRYFQSRLFNAHRASIRSAAAQHVVKDDPIFDQYLERDDDELEPRRQRESGVHTFIDLGATKEDHGETGNENDVTMQAGRQRATLPLIRKFNEHSERLLKAAMSDEPPSKKRRTDDLEIAQLDLEDLHDAASSAGIALDMGDRSRYEGQQRNGSSSGNSHSNGNGNGNGAAMDLDGMDAAPTISAKDARAAAVAAVAGWQPALAALHLERKPAEAALRDMTTTVAARLDSQTRRNDIPESLLRQMTTAQTAANEFLRQFWLAIYPTSADPPPGPPPTPAQKAEKVAKAARMAGFLARTPEKVDALVREAQRQGVEYVKVETAMKPIMDAVNHALAFHQARVNGPLGRK